MTISNMHVDNKRQSLLDILSAIALIERLPVALSHHSCKVLDDV